MNILRALQVFGVAKNGREALALVKREQVTINNQLEKNPDRDILGQDEVQIFKRESFNKVFRLHTKYHYTAYWGTWSRRLAWEHEQGPFVDLNLTPPPTCYDSTWDNDVRPIRIRAHGTCSEGRDKDVDILPEDIFVAMELNLGLELTKRLLNEDFLSQIDWNKYRRYCNGGANLEDIKKS